MLRKVDEGETSRMFPWPNNLRVNFVSRFIYLEDTALHSSKSIPGLMWIVSRDHNCCSLFYAPLGWLVVSFVSENSALSRGNKLCKRCVIFRNEKLQEFVLFLVYKFFLLKRNIDIYIYIYRFLFFFFFF